MEAIAVLGIVVAIAVIAAGSLKNVPLFPLVILSSAIVIVTNQMSPWEAVSGTFITGMQGALTTFFLPVLAANIYSTIMDTAGSTRSIAWWCLDTFGTKNVVLVLFVAAAILGMAGMNGISMCYTLYGIMYALLREANLPRSFMTAFVVFGGAQFTAGFLPISVNSANVVAGQLLGTPLTAGAVPATIGCVLVLVLTYIYLKVMEARAIKAGNGWTDPQGVDPAQYSLNASEKATLPSRLQSFLPMFILIGFVIFGSVVGLNAGLTAVGALVLAALSCWLLSIKFLREKKFSVVDCVESSFRRTINTLVPLFAILGFGGLLSASTGYQVIVESAMSLDMPIYMKIYIAAAIVALIAASTGGAIRIALTTLGDYIMSSGANLEYIHRIVAMAGQAWANVPHNSAFFMINGVFGLKQSEGYPHCFWILMVIPSVVSFLITLALSFL